MRKDLVLCAHTGWHEVLWDVQTTHALLLNCTLVSMGNNLTVKVEINTMASPTCMHCITSQFADDRVHVHCKIMHVVKTSQLAHAFFVMNHWSKWSQCKVYGISEQNVCTSPGLNQYPMVTNMHSCQWINSKKNLFKMNRVLFRGTLTRFLFNFTRFIFKNCKLSEESKVKKMLNTCQKYRSRLLMLICYISEKYFAFIWLLTPHSVYNFWKETW